MDETLFTGMNFNLAPDVQAGFVRTENWPSSIVRSVKQTHGSQGHQIFKVSTGRMEGDFLWTLEPFLPIGIAVADCTAILFTGENLQGRFVAGIHAGWRGTAAGVIERAFETIAPMKIEASWVSPSICREHFEVGEEVLQQLGPEAYRFAVAVSSDDRTSVDRNSASPRKFFLDLKKLQLERLKSLGAHPLVSPLCTYCQPEFASYRQFGRELKARQIAWVALGLREGP